MAANRKTLDTDLIYLREIYARTPFNQTIPANQVLVSNGDDSTRWDYVGASSFRSVTGNGGSTLVANNTTTELKITTAGPPGLLDSYVDISAKSLVLRATPPVLAISERPVPVITGAVVLSPPAVKQITNYSTVTMIGVKDVLLSTVTVNGAPPAIFLSISSFTSAGYSTISGEAFAWRPYLYNVLSTAQGQPTFTSSMSTTWATGVQNISTAEAYPDYLTGDAYFSTVSFNMSNYIGYIRPKSQVVLEVEPTYLFPRFLLGSEEYPTLLKNISSYIEYSGASTSVLSGSMNSDMIVSQQSNAYTSNVFNKHMKMPIDSATILDNWATDGATGYYTLYHRIPGGMAQLIPGDSCGYYIGQRGGMSNAEPTYTNATPVQNGVFMSIYNTIPFPLTPEELEAQIRISPAPGGFTTGTVGQTEGTISWQGAVGAIGYQFIVNGVTITPTTTTFQLFSMSITVTTSGKTATFTGLDPGTTYSIVVIAIRAGGGQTRSGTFYLTTRPSPPTNLALVSATGDSFTVSWTSSTGATDYLFTLNGLQTSPFSYTAQSARFTNLTANTAYILGISATNSGGATASETGLSLTTAPGAPRNFTSIIGITSMTIQWSGAEGATSFIYLVNGAAATPNTQGANSANFINLTPNTVYNFVVTARGPSGNTDSAVYSVSTGGPLINLSSTVTGTSFTVSWMGSLDTATYTYTLNGNPPSTYGILVSTTGKTATFTRASPLTNYTVIVTATIDGVLYASDPYSLTTLQAPPEAPIVTSNSITSTTFTLSWQPTTATSYTYTRSGVTIVASEETSTSATFRNLTPATPYSIVVTATSGSGSTASSPISVTTRVSPPVVSSTNITSSSFILTWSPVANTTYSFTNNGAAITPFETSAGSARFTGLTPATTYNIVVIGTNAGGPSPSNPISVTTLILPPLVPIVTASNIGPRTFRLSWQPTGAATYAYTRGGITIVPSEQTSTSATFSNLTPSTQYVIVITATNIAGSVTSNPISVTTLIPEPVAPVLSSSLITTNSFRVSWTPVANVTYSYTNSGEPIATSSVGSGFANFANLTPGTQYSIVVTATNAGGPSPSNPISITTRVSPPIVSSSNITSESFRLSWTPVANVTYTFTRSGASIVPSETSSGSAIFRNLTPETLYTTVVIATNAGGPSSSNPISVTTLVQSTIVTASNITDTSYTLTWTVAANTTYTYKRGGATVIPDQSSAGSATFNNLTPATRYDDIVVVATKAGIPVESDPISVTTKLAPPVTPTVTIVSSTPNSAILSLSSSVGATTVVTNVTIGGASVTGIQANFDQSNNQISLSPLIPNTDYSVTVTSSNADYSVNSQPIALTTPFVDLTLTSSEITISGFKVSWDANTGPTTFTFTLDGAAVTPSSTSTSATFTDLSPNRSYTVVVTSNGPGRSRTDSIIVPTGIVAPTAPILTLASVTSGGARIEWQAGTGGATFTASVKTLPGNIDYPEAIAQLDGNAFNLGNLFTNTAYSVVVGASNTLGDISSTPLNIHTLTATPSITQGTITENSISVTWQSGINADRYGYTLNNISATPSTSTSTSATFSDLSGNTRYTLRVIAYTPLDGAASGSTEFETQLGTPQIFVTAITSVGFTLNWQSGLNAASYRYYAENTDITPSSFTENSATFTTLNSNFAYYNTYIVAYGYRDIRNTSNTLVIRTKLGQPTNVVITNLLYKSFTISWTLGRASNLTIIQITGGPSSPNYSDPGTTTAFTGLSGSTQYTLTLLAAIDSYRSDPLIITVTTPAQPQPEEFRSLYTPNSSGVSDLPSGYVVPTGYSQMYVEILGGSGGGGGGGRGGNGTGGTLESNPGNGGGGGAYLTGTTLITAGTSVTLSQNVINGGIAGATATMTTPYYPLPGGNGNSVTLTIGSTTIVIGGGNGGDAGDAGGGWPVPGQPDGNSAAGQITGTIPTGFIARNGTAGGGANVNDQTGGVGGRSGKDEYSGGNGGGGSRLDGPGQAGANGYYVIRFT